MGFPLLTIEQFLEWKGSGCASSWSHCCYEGNCTPAHEANQHFCDGGGGFHTDTVWCWDPQTGALDRKADGSLEDCQEKCDLGSGYVDGACCAGSTCWIAQEIDGIQTAAERCEAGNSFMGYGPGVYQGDGTECAGLFTGFDPNIITCPEEEEEEGLGSIWIEEKNCCCKESPCMKKEVTQSDPWGLPGTETTEMVSVGAFGDLSCGCSKRLIGEMNSETDPFGTSEVPCDPEFDGDCENK